MLKFVAIWYIMAISKPKKERFSMLIRYFIPPFSAAFQLQTNCPVLINLLCLKHGQYLTETPTMTSHTITALRQGSTCNYEISHGDTHFVTANPLYAVEDIIYHHRDFLEKVLALHGAAVTDGNYAHIFLAATTSGKTTLTAYLIHSGFDYITDDCVLLDREEFSIHPFTTPLHLREGSLEVLKRYAVLPKALTYLEDEIFARYVFTPDNCVTASLPLGGIFFLHRTEERNALEEMSLTDRITGLLHSPITAYPMSKEYLIFISRLAKFPCYRLYYSDMNYVKELLQNEFSACSPIITGTDPS